MPFMGVSPIHIPVPMMAQNTPPSQSVVSRRRTIVGTAALATGGLGLLAVGSDNARADVSVSELSVLDHTSRSEHGQIIDVWLTASGELQWESQDVLPDGYQLDLELAKTPADVTDKNYDRIARTSGSIFSYSGNDQFTVSGNVLDHVSFSASDFEATESGQIVATDLYVRLVLRIRTGDETLVESSTTDSGTITVENTSMQIESSVSASVEPMIRHNSTDPTPDAVA